MVNIMELDVGDKFSFVDEFNGRIHYYRVTEKDKFVMSFESSFGRFIQFRLREIEGTMVKTISEEEWFKAKLEV